MLLIMNNLCTFICYNNAIFADILLQIWAFRATHFTHLYVALKLNNILFNMQPSSLQCQLLYKTVNSVSVLVNLQTECSIKY